jgi:predicted site-specific integrase-resolvase
MNREEAARHLSVSPTTFDGWVKRGLMPKARGDGKLKRWVRTELEDAFMRIPSEGDAEEVNPWDARTAS